MSNLDKTHRVIARSDAITLPNRPGPRTLEVPHDLPGIVIFIHGVNDPGASYSRVEAGLCQGLNERLDLNGALKPGSYGESYRQAKALMDTRDRRRVADVLYDPDTYLYERKEAGNTNSVFIPFYWGYRADNREIARDANNDPLRVRSQYQDLQGNRLDANFAKGGGFFSNATNNIVDMYQKGFEAPLMGGIVTRNNLGGNDVFIGDCPPRRYFVLAAERLAMLISTIRTIQPMPHAAAAGMLPEHDTITVMGHSQGTLITLLAQAILARDKQRYADCIIMVDSPYNLATATGTTQSVHARLKTFVDIVNEVTREKDYSIPTLADMLLQHERDPSVRAGPRWTPARGQRPGKDGGDWISFEERDNRRKVYLYFCPEDTVVALDSVQGIGTFGVPDHLAGDRPMPASELPPVMNILKDMRFYQRMWTRMLRPRPGQNGLHPVLVGHAPGRYPIREDNERSTVGPEGGFDMVVNPMVYTAHKQRDIRLLNGEALNPPHEPDLYGGEVVRGGPGAGNADRAGLLTPDDVSKNVALGNRHASFRWIKVTTSISEDTAPHKNRFNANNTDLHDRAENWRAIRNGDSQYVIQREETPNEARTRMETDPSVRTKNNYHSGVLNSTENHRWVTAMDVAVGQAVTLDDPEWRKVLLFMGQWRLSARVMTEFSKCNNFKRLPARALALINASAQYYQNGLFPEESLVPLQKMPSLVTDKTKKSPPLDQLKSMAEQAASEGGKPRAFPPKAPLAPARTPK